MARRRSRRQAGDDYAVDDGRARKDRRALNNSLSLNNSRVEQPGSAGDPVSEPGRPSRVRPNRGKGLPPSQRPSKICPVCQRPFLWRRRWASVWEQVIYCSERCRNRRNQTSAAR